MLESYGTNFEPFNYLPTNSAYGRVAGYCNAALAALRIPFARFKGRKIAHFHYASYKSWKRKKILMSIARMSGFRIVAHCHGNGMKEFCKEKGYDIMGKALNSFDANIVLSESWKDFFENTLKCSNVHVVNNIVPRPEKIENPKHPDDTARFLFMGMLGDRKGIFDILEAAARLKNAGYKFHIVVGGNGEIKRFHDEVKRLSLEDFVEFRGWMSGEKKTRALTECDVLLLPSHNEGLPIAILEAMSYGKGILTSPVGGIPEIVTDGKNGFLVTPGNVDEIECAMKKYIEDRYLARQQGEASQSVIDAFYPESVKAQLVGIYRNILENRGADKK